MALQPFSSPSSPAAARILTKRRRLATAPTYRYTPVMRGTRMELPSARIQRPLRIVMNQRTLCTLTPPARALLLSLRTATIRMPNRSLIAQTSVRPTTLVAAADALARRGLLGLLLLLLLYPQPTVRAM